MRNNDNNNEINNINNSDINSNNNMNCLSNYINYLNRPLFSFSSSNNYSNNINNLGRNSNFTYQNTRDRKYYIFNIFFILLYFPFIITKFFILVL